MSEIPPVVVDAVTEHPQLPLGERYSRGALYSLAGAIASRALILLQGIVVARYLGVELFGVFSIITAVTMLVTSFAGFGLGSALIKYVPEFLVKEPKQVGGIVRHSVLAAIVAASATVALFFFSAPLLASKVYSRPDLTGFFRLSAFIVLSLTLFNMGSAVLVAFQRFQEYAWRVPAGYAVQFCAVGLGVSALGLRGALIGLLVGPLAGLAVALPALEKIRRDFGLTFGRKKWGWSWPLMRSILNFSIPAQMSGYISAPVFWAGNTILALKKGYAEVGLFNVAFIFYQAVLFVPQNLSLPALPVFSEVQATGDWTRFNRILNKNIRAMLVVTLPVCFTLALLGRPLVVFLYGEQYGAAGGVVFVTSFTALLFVIVYAIQVPIMSLGKMWDIFVLYVPWAGIALALAWYCIPSRGSLGLAGAYFVSYLALAVLMWQDLERRLKFRFDRKLRIICTSVVVIGLAYAGAFYFSRSSWLLAVVLGPVLVWAEWNSILDEEDRNLVKDMLRKLIIQALRAGRKMTA